VTADAFLLSAHGPAATVRHAVAAEAAGFAGVWLAEHHFIRYGGCPSAMTLAAHVLGATSRLQVGTAACVLSNRHPVALGEEAAMLSALAPGRFQLGVARGGPWVDLEVFGTGLDRYRHGFPEALDLLRAWLSGAVQVGAAGDFFRFREVSVVPRPECAGPIWVAATSSSTVDIAAARGLPLLLGVHDDLAAKEAMLDRYADTAAAHGHDPDGVPHASVHLAYPADSRAAGERVLRPALRQWLAGTHDYVRIDGSVSPRRDLDDYVEHLLRVHPVGPDCAEELTAAAKRLGVPRMLLMVEAAGGPPAVLDLVGRLGSQVLPHLRYAACGAV
jgi:alkanesulfonate monooxygenase SsuD/methylene tetrahydromethanopterin reductase-like flavin-dependent oxidoreductase (luciferase family)